MKDSFLKALTGAKGRIITMVSGAVAAVIVRALVKMGWEPDPATLNDITEFSGVAVTLGLEWVVIHLSSEGVKKIQDALPPAVKSDGVPGPKTIAAVEKLAEQADSPSKPDTP
jgi:hypothetical protein